MTSALLPSEVIIAVVILICVHSPLPSFAKQCFKCNGQECKSGEGHLEVCASRGNVCAMWLERKDNPKRGVKMGDIHKKGCVEVLLFHTDCKAVDSRHNKCACRRTRCNSNSMRNVFSGISTTIKDPTTTTMITTTSKRVKQLGRTFMKKKNKKRVHEPTSEFVLRQSSTTPNPANEFSGLMGRTLLGEVEDATTEFVIRIIGRSLGGENEQETTTEFIPWQSSTTQNPAIEFSRPMGRTLIGEIEDEETTTGLGFKMGGKSLGGEGEDEATTEIGFEMGGRSLGGESEQETTTELIPFQSSTTPNPANEFSRPMGRTPIGKVEESTTRSGFEMGGRSLGDEGEETTTELILGQSLKTPKPAIEFSGLMGRTLLEEIEDEESTTEFVIRSLGGESEQETTTEFIPFQSSTTPNPANEFSRPMGRITLIGEIEDEETTTGLGLKMDGRFLGGEETTTELVLQQSSTTPSPAIEFSGLMGRTLLEEIEDEESATEFVIRALGRESEQETTTEFTLRQSSTTPNPAIEFSRPMGRTPIGEVEESTTGFGFKMDGRSFGGEGEDETTTEIVTLQSSTTPNPAIQFSTPIGRTLISKVEETTTGHGIGGRSLGNEGEDKTTTEFGIEICEKSLGCEDETTTEIILQRISTTPNQAIQFSTPMWRTPIGEVEESTTRSGFKMGGRSLGGEGDDETTTEFVLRQVETTLNPPIEFSTPMERILIVEVEDKETTIGSGFRMGGISLGDEGETRTKFEFKMGGRYLGSEIGEDESLSGFSYRPDESFLEVEDDKEHEATTRFRYGGVYLGGNIEDDKLSGFTFKSEVEEDKTIYGSS